MRKIGGLGLFAVLTFTLLAPSQAGGYRRDGGCNYSVGYRNGPCFPRPFMGVPVMGYAPWVSSPVVMTRTVVYQTRRSDHREVSGTLAQAQLRLARLGYYDGAIDGDFGPRTARAIRLYQAENGLAITGRLDNRTLRSLGI